MSWEDIYNFFGIKDFIYFISDPRLQGYLFPVKLVFVTCGMFFMAFVIYFMINSSWLQYKFLEDVTEFFSWQSFGAREINKRWNKIKKRLYSGIEADYKLAVIDADDFLAEALDDRGYEGKDFTEILKKAGKSIEPMFNDLLRAHEVRNTIVFNPAFKLSVEEAKKIVDTYESAVSVIEAS